MRVVYMGTPDFAVLPLKRIYEAGHEVVGVYTQPDKPKGRSKKLIPSDVKVAAEELGIAVYQPEKLRDSESVEVLRELNPDIIVVAAYGQILSEDILNLPKFGCINIHASLLPKYRGASPIESSIINGDEKTGVTIMYMAKGLDTGDIISQAEIEIGKHNTETLTAALSDMGADLVVKTMTEIENGTSTRTPQNDDESCYAGKLDKAMGLLDFSQSSEKIERLVRGLYPWPCAYTSIGGKNVKILEADVVDEVQMSKKFLVGTGSGALIFKKLQPEGKKPMDLQAFLNGNKIEVGESIG